MRDFARSGKLGWRTGKEEQYGDLKKRALGTEILSEDANFVFSIAVYVK